ncbi:hypothetical protein ACRAWF_45815 [Streptomyces sp. L7]
MKTYREWLGVRTFEANLSLGGSFASDRVEDYYVTPWDLGYGHILKFDHDFIGREALERRKSEKHRRKAWLAWHRDDVARVFASPVRAGRPALQVHRDARRLLRRLPVRPRREQRPARRPLDPVQRTPPTSAAGSPSS